MKKILVMLIIITCMMLSVAACGSDSQIKKNEHTSVVKTESSIKSEDDKETSINNTSINNTSINNTSEKDVTDIKSASEANEELAADKGYEKLKESEGFEFESNGDGTCTLKQIGACSDKDIVIPEKSPSGDKITKIAKHAFYNAEDIDSIIFVGKTMKLDKRAFQSCEVKKIVITGCEFNIGENAFSYCDDMKELYISNSKLEVEEYAFYDTGKKMNVTIKNCNGILGKKGFQSSGIKDLTINGCSFEFGENAFSYCEDLENIKMENSNLEIGSYAFYDSGDNMAVSFNDCKLELGSKSFQSCDMITLTISGSDTVIGENAFSYCDDLTDVVIGENKTEIKKYAFYDCKSLANVSIAADSKDDDIEINIKDNAFQTCGVQKVVIGRGKIKLGDNTFSYCENLESVEIKGSSLKVGKYVFYDCPAELSISYNGSNYNKESIEKVK